jgi:ABC-type Na+ efflux pump permease subunit
VAALLVRVRPSSWETGGSHHSAGLTLELLLLFGIYGASASAVRRPVRAAGSLVAPGDQLHRHADVAVATAATCSGVCGVGRSTSAGWIVALSQVPLVSPFMMLGRITTGEAMVWEVVLSVTLLIVAIVGALWLAARIYAAGVLLYGQRPGARAIWRLVRSGT